MTPLRELAEYGEMKQLLAKNTGIALTGCVDSQKLHMIAGLGEEFKIKIILTFSDLRTKEIAEDFRIYDRNIVVYPGKDLIFYQADIHGKELVRERISVLRRIVEKRPMTLITTFSALMSPLMPLEIFEKHIIGINKQSRIEERRMAEALVTMGYEKVFQVESPGQFSVRGGIIDVFDLTEENPYRIELWGDEVDSIRSFDVLSQRSVENLESIRIYPATEMILPAEKLREGMKKIEAEAKAQAEVLRKEFRTEEAHRIATQIQELKEEVLELQAVMNLESYVNYFFEETQSLIELFKGQKSCVFLEEPIRIKEHANGVEMEFRESMSHRLEKGYALPGQADILYGKERVLAAVAKYPTVQIGFMEDKNLLLKTPYRYNITAKSVASYNNSFELLLKDLKRYRSQKYRVVLLSPSKTRAGRLAEDLRNEGMTAVYSADPFREAQPGEILVLYGSVKRGFEYPLLKFVVISESDIFGTQQKKKKKLKNTREPKSVTLQS